MAEQATGFEFKLADGSVVKAENIEEAFKTVAKMKEDTAAALKGEREQREALQAQMDALRQEVQQRNTPPPQEGAFNKDHYYKLVGEDPIKANRYLLAHDFGISDPDMVPTYFQNMQTTVTNLEQQTLAAAFTSEHPDFPAGTEAAKVLTAEVVKLHNLGHPVTRDTLELAWQNCVSSEAIKPLEPEEQREEPNPSPGGGGSGPTDAEAARIEQDVMSGKMSMGDFEKYLRSKNMIP